MDKIHAPQASNDLGSVAVARLAPSDAHPLLVFRDTVIKGLENPDFLHEETDEPGFVARLLDRGAFTLGVLSSGRLRAYCAVIVPQSHDDLLPFGIARNVEAIAAPRHTAYIAATMVAKDARGLGLQNLLTRLRTGLLLELDRPHHFATAALGNHFSWRNALSNGFHVTNLLEFDDPTYGPLMRFLLHRSPFREPADGDISWVAATDADRHRAHLSAGKLGWKYRQECGEAQLGYLRSSRV